MAPKLTPKQVARLERQAELGPEAQSLLSIARAGICPHCRQNNSIFNERKNQIIREAIEWFETPSANSDSHVAVRFIAALVEVNKLEDALEYRVEKANSARATLFSETTKTASA